MVDGPENASNDALKTPLIRLDGIRLDDWVNPFGASPEELLAGTLEEGGLLGAQTQINGRPAQDLFQAYNRKRRQFQESTRLGSMLTKMGILTQEQLGEALVIQKRENRPLGEIIVQLGFCEVATIEGALEKQKSIRVELEKVEQAQEERRSLWKKLSHFFNPSEDIAP
ncbi:MAG: hypothetical protein K2X66_16835 [Cyanobacteria bacterium]|nr:hypothetical protein [Cyanobacteriota bacterium]